MKPDDYTSAEARAALLELDLSGPIKGEVYMVMLDGWPKILAYTGVINRVGQYNFRVADWEAVDDPKDGVLKMPPMDQCAWRGVLPKGWQLMLEDRNAKYIGITHAKLVP